MKLDKIQKYRDKNEYTNSNRISLPLGEMGAKTSNKQQVTYI